MVGKLTDDRWMSCSRLPAMLGHSEYSTPNDELLRSFEARQGIEATFNANEAMEWGNTLEPVILYQAGKRLGLVVNAEIDQAVKDERLPLYGSLDGTGHTADSSARPELVTDAAAGIFVLAEGGRVVLDGPGVLEAKLTSAYPEESPPLWQGPIQLQGQMMCTKLKWGCVAVLYRGIQLHLYLYDPHPATMGVIHTQVLDFERRLESDPPDWYPIENVSDAVMVYGEANEEPPLELPDELGPAVANLFAAQRAIRNATKVKEERSAEIMAKMGNHGTAVLERFDIKWPDRKYAAQPEKIVPAKAAYVKRQSTVTVSERVEA